MSDAICQVLFFGGLLSVDVDHKIATQIVPPNQERIFHRRAVVDRDQNFLLEAVPFERQLNLVSPMVVIVVDAPNCESARGPQ